MRKDVRDRFLTLGFDTNLINKIVGITGTKYKCLEKFRFH
jgi:hypothetical protein